MNVQRFHDAEDATSKHQAQSFTSEDAMADKATRLSIGQVFALFQLYARASVPNQFLPHAAARPTQSVTLWLNLSCGRNRRKGAAQTGGANSLPRRAMVHFHSTSGHTRGRPANCFTKLEWLGCGLLYASFNKSASSTP